MHWFYLFSAICIEVFATSMLKLADGFTSPLPSVAVVFGYGLSLYCLSLALRVIPVGIAYAIWSGVGIIGISIIGWLAYGQKLDPPAMAGLALILAGILVINLFSNSLSR